MQSFKAQRICLYISLLKDYVFYVKEEDSPISAAILGYMLTMLPHDHLSKLAQQLTKKASQRYDLHRKMIHRIQNDLWIPQIKKLSQRLEVWWKLPFKAFQEELVKVFKHDIPLKDRNDWEELLKERTTEIHRLTDEIVRLETELNVKVYEAFGLNDEERKLIEQETKYQYGEW